MDELSKAIVELIDHHPECLIRLRSMPPPRSSIQILVHVDLVHIAAEISLQDIHEAVHVDLLAHEIERMTHQLDVELTPAAETK